MIQNLIIYQLILISLILSIKAQLKWNFEIEDSEENNIPTIDSNLRSTFEIPTENEMEFKTVINVCLGTKPQCFNLGVQTNTFYIWVHSFNSRETNSDSKINVFDYTKSTTIQRNNNFFKKILFGRRIIGFEARDILTINGKDYSKINFLILESSESLRMIDGFIGLGYTPNNDERKFSETSFSYFYLQLFLFKKYNFLPSRKNFYLNQSNLLNKRLPVFESFTINLSNQNAQHEKSDDKYNNEIIDKNNSFSTISNTSNEEVEPKKGFNNDLELVGFFQNDEIDKSSKEKMTTTCKMDDKTLFNKKVYKENIPENINF